MYMYIEQRGRERESETLSGLILIGRVGGAERSESQG